MSSNTSTCSIERAITLGTNKKKINQLEYRTLECDSLNYCITQTNMKLKDFHNETTNLRQKLFHDASNNNIKHINTNVSILKVILL